MKKQINGDVLIKFILKIFLNNNFNLNINLIMNFIKNILKKSNTKLDIIIITIIYIYRINIKLKYNKIKIDDEFICILFLILLIISNKYHHDYNCKHIFMYWEKISGINKKYLIHYEKTFLKMLNYNLHINSKEYKKVRNIFKNNINIG